MAPSRNVLDIRSGNSLVLFDSNATAGGALYVGEITGAVISGSSITNISGAAGINIYYDPALPGNAYLGGLAFFLTLIVLGRLHLGRLVRGARVQRLRVG